MIPKIARITLNILLGCVYALIISLVVGFAAGIAIGFGNGLSDYGEIGSAGEGVIYALSGMIAVTLFIVLLAGFRKQAFIQKEK